MRPSKPTPWLNRFAWLVSVLTLLLVCSGGMVTSKNVGLAVPDWPTTFGYNMFWFPVSRWVGGVFFEHTHRLVASTVGFLTVILAAWLWAAEGRRWVRILGLFAVAAVVLQGLLGGLRVTLLKDEIGIFHACLAQGFLALLTVIALVTSGVWRRLSEETVSVTTTRRLAWSASLIAVLIYGQLALGAAMRHQHRDLSIPDFPRAYGQWIPATNSGAVAAINTWRDAKALSDVTASQIWLQWAHRLGAGVIFAAVVAFFAATRWQARGSKILRRVSSVWLLLIVMQVTLGAWTIWSNKAADIATAHVAIGAISLSTAVLLSVMCWRMSARRMQRATPTPELHPPLFAAASH